MANTSTACWPDGLMSLSATPTALAIVVLIEPDVFIDERGHFVESFSARDFAQATGLSRGFVQDNHGSSRKGALRGITRW